MSLDWNVRKVKDFETVTTLVKEDGSKHWSPITEALVWHSLCCGFNSITEKNWESVWDRIRVWEKVKGPMLHLAFLTKGDVQLHIGMNTNANTKTLARFAKGLLEER